MKMNELFSKYFFPVSRYFFKIISPFGELNPQNEFIIVRKDTNIGWFLVRLLQFEHENFPMEIIPIESFSPKHETVVRRKLFKTAENEHLLPPFLQLKYWECPPYFEIPMPKHWDFPNVWLVAWDGEPNNLLLVQGNEKGSVTFSSISDKQYQEQLHAKKKNQEPPFFIRWV